MSESALTLPVKKKRKAPPTAFKPGQSGNPGGVSKEITLVRDRVRAFLVNACPEAAQKLFELLHSEDQKVVVAAAREILDRGLGPPKQEIEITNNERLGKAIAAVAVSTMTVTTTDEE